LLRGAGGGVVLVLVLVLVFVLSGVVLPELSGETPEVTTVVFALVVLATVEADELRFLEQPWVVTAIPATAIPQTSRFRIFMFPPEGLGLLLLADLGQCAGQSGAPCAAGG
jgi:hypothetical protein